MGRRCRTRQSWSEERRSNGWMRTWGDNPQEEGGDASKITILPHQYIFSVALRVSPQSTSTAGTKLLPSSFIQSLLHLSSGDFPTFALIEIFGSSVFPLFCSSDDEDEYRLQRTLGDTPGSNTPSAKHRGEDLALRTTDPEKRHLEEGDYIGTRRFTRTLERGPEAKAEVDAVVDACGVLINLRTAIMRYRKPKSLEKFFR